MTIIKVPLNRYMVQMVNPKKCIRGRDHRIGKHDHMQANTCEHCIFCNGDTCEYETVTVEYASGKFASKYDKDHEICYEQFCCPDCGELIAREDDSSVTMHDWNIWGISCKHCKAIFVMLKDDFEKKVFTLARKAPSTKKNRPKTEWCQTIYCPDCPDSDTCSESRK